MREGAVVGDAVVGEAAVFRVLGPVSVVTPLGTHALGRNRRTALLAHLLCSLDRVVPFTELENQLATDRKNVMKEKFRLKRDLELHGVDVATLIETRPDGYRMWRRALNTDGDTFTRHVDDAERRLDSDAGEALRLSTAALEMWAEPFQGLRSTLVIDAACIELEGMRRRAQRIRARALLANGRTEPAVAELGSLLEDDPDDEALCAELAIGLCVLGRRNEAYEVVRGVLSLHEERGTEASPALRAVEEDLLLGRVTYLPSALRPSVRIGAEAGPTVLRRRGRIGRSKYVGHADDLASLGVLAARVSRSGSAVCCIIGEPGMGKTRLIEEFASSPAAAGFRQCWLAFHAADAGPFRRVSAVIDEISDGLRSEEDVSPDVPDEVVDDRLVRTVLRQASAHPLLLMLEDLHWADARSLQFCRALFGALNRQPADDPARVLVLATSRPEMRCTTQDWLDEFTRGRVSSTVELEPLTDFDMHELVRELGVPQPAPGLIATVRTISAGNPLGIRSLLARLERTGSLLVDHGTTVLDPADDSIPVGGRVDALVQAHLDTLTAAGRSVVGAVAIAGDHAERPLLAHLVGDDETTRRGIEEARDHGVLVERAGRVAFEHPLMAPAALAATTPDRAWALHAAAARWLSVAHPDDDAATTHAADHLVRAGRSAGAADLATVCAAAGEIAMGVSAWSDADRYLSAALDGATRLGWPSKTLAERKLRVALAAFRDHQVARAAWLFDDVAAFGRRTQDLALWGDGIVHRVRCRVHDIANLDADHERQALEEFLVASDRPGRSVAPLRAGAHQLLATLAWGRGDFGLSAVHGERALAIAEREDDPLVRSQSAGVLGLARTGLLQLSSAIEAFDVSRQFAAAASQGQFTAWGVSRTSYALWMLGDLRGAGQAARQAAGGAEATSNWAEASLAWTYVAGIDHATGHLDAARQHAAHAARLGARSGYYWAGTLLLPVRLSIALDGGDEPALVEIVEDWQQVRLLPRYLRVLLAIKRHDTDEMHRDAAALVARPVRAPTATSIVGAVAAAELAMALRDPHLARWSLDQLRAPEAGEVVIVPAINRLVTHSVGLCHAALDDHETALTWLSNAQAEASSLGMPIERARIDAAVTTIVDGRSRPGA